jgi:hypothetical protein
MLDPENKRTAIESLNRMSDVELKNFITVHLCLYGPSSKLLVIAEEIQGDRNHVK